MLAAEKRGCRLALSILPLFEWSQLSDCTGLSGRSLCTGICHCVGCRNIPCEGLATAPLLFLAHQHKAAGMEIKLSKTTTTTGYHMALNVARKATDSPFEEQ